MGRDDSIKDQYTTPYIIHNYCVMKRDMYREGVYFYAILPTLFSYFFPLVLFLHLVTFVIFLSWHQTAETQCWRRRIVRPSVCAYISGTMTYCLPYVHALVIEAESSVTLIILAPVHIIALRSHSKSDYGFAY